jgi:hypothetical protein
VLEADYVGRPKPAIGSTGSEHILLTILLREDEPLIEGFIYCWESFLHY